VHLRTSLVQLFALLQLNFDEVVQIIELRRFGGAPNGYPFAALVKTMPPVGEIERENENNYYSKTLLGFMVSSLSDFLCYETVLISFIGTANNKT
jgi:hypothetical protein